MKMMFLVLLSILSLVLLSSNVYSFSSPSTGSNPFIVMNKNIGSKICHGTDRATTTIGRLSKMMIGQKGIFYNNYRTAGNTCLNMIESISVSSLDNNHEIVGQEMADSIVRWLNNEWMEQSIHVKIGQQCKETYIQCRINNDNDLMSIMTNIADDLTKQWHLYNADAFVNAWDISNYVSDYLTSKTGITDECSCSSKIY